MKRIILLIIVGILSLSLNVYAEEPSSWAEEAIEDLKTMDLLDKSIFSSYQDNITRLEFASLMVHFYELYKGEIIVDTSIVFTDTNDTMALKAATVGISSGVGDGKYDPSASITREQMAVLLVNTLELCQIELGEGDLSYVDEAAISSWAKKGVRICSGEGLLSGTGENKFSPRGTATKEMAYVVFDKMINTVPMAKRLAIRKLIESEKYPLNEIIRNYNACDEVILEVNRLSETYDYDKDGISDYYEIYRNFTNPVLADTDGDGLLDGDWLERTEYTYVIKLQVRLLAPYDLDFIESHIEQDMKLLEETEDYADIELIIYPFHKLDQTLVANKNYKEDNEEIMNGIQPGLTNDWDEKYREDLVALLKDNGIDPDTMSDQDLIFSILYFFEMEDYKGDEGYISEFSDITETGYHMYDWYTSFVDGKAVINPLILDKRPKVTQEIETTLDMTAKDFEAYTGLKWTKQDLLDLTSSSKEMFYQRAHGSCSGTSEFYASVFQALGIPAKVMPIATTIDTGKLHDEEGSKHQSLYRLRVDQADNFSNKSVKNAWLRGLDDFGSNHVMSYVYLGNRWINVDIAGGMNFNRQPVMGNFIVFHKTADYDFYETLQKITEQWLITDHKYFDQFVKSDNFDSKANDVYHYYGNFSLKVFEIYDAYGSHITSEIKSLADKAETNERDMLNMGRELRLKAYDEVYYAFDNRDNFDLVLDTYYPNVNLSFFGIYNHLQENPEKFIHENAHLMISTGISYNDLPDVLRNRVSSEAYQTLKSGVTTYEISGAFVHFLKP